MFAEVEQLTPTARIRGRGRPAGTLAQARRNRRAVPLRPAGARRLRALDLPAARPDLPLLVRQLEPAAVDPGEGRRLGELPHDPAPPGAAAGDRHDHLLRRRAAPRRGRDPGVRWGRAQPGRTAFALDLSGDPLHAGADLADRRGHRLELPAGAERRPRQHGRRLVRHGATKLAFRGGNGAGPCSRSPAGRCSDSPC